MAVTQYIGARYVTKFADPIEWSNTKTYEPLTVVQHQGDSYVSKQAVPIGVDITDARYWLHWSDYNAQVEQYRRETARVSDELTNTNENLAQTNENLAQTNENLAQTNENVSDITRYNYFIDAFNGETREDKLFNALDTIDYGILYVGQLTITKQYDAINKDYRNIIISNGTITFEISEWFNQAESVYKSVPTFANCVLYGNNGTLFNGDYNCIGPKFDSCKISNLACFNSATKYVQSLSLNDCVLNPVTNFVTATTIYDMHIVGTKVESAGGILIKTIGQSGFVGGSIEGSLIEGRSDVVIECDAITQLSINGNYFESNNGGFLKQLNASWPCNIYVSDNVFLGTMDNTEYMFEFASTSRNVTPYIANNIFHIANKYIANVQRTTKTMLSPNSNISGSDYSDSNFAPNRNGKFIKQYVGFRAGTFNTSDNTWHYSISIPYGEAYSVMNPFIVVFSGSSQSATPIRQGGLIATCIPFITSDAKIAVKTTIISAQNQTTATAESTATIEVTPDNNNFNSSNVTFDIKIGGFVNNRGRFFIMDFTNMINSYLG